MYEKSDVLPFTGERFLPEVPGQIAYEHLHRYYFAMPLVKGLRVLDVACGEGYGSDIMSSVASEVVGVDVAPEAVVHANSRYGSKKLSFIAASAASLPFESQSFDVVVSFETIEHLAQQEEMLGEIKRVLKAGGLLVISSPDKQHYSIIPNYQNPFHVKELFKEEFVDLVSGHFKNSALMLQRVVHGSMIVGDNFESLFESHFLDGDKYKCTRSLSAPLYDLIVASDSVLPKLSASVFEASTHGMPPADFYGVHLPERIAKADELVASLRGELALHAMPESNVRSFLDAVSEAIAQVVQDNRHAVQEQLAGLATVYESIVTGLNDLVAEKETRLETAKHLASERDAAMAELRQHSQALSDLRSKLEGDLQDSRRQIAELQTERRGNEALASELRALIAEKETRLVTAGHALGQRDAATAELRKHAEALTIVRGELEGEVQDGRRRIAELLDQRKIDEAQVTELRALVVEMESRLATAVAQNSDTASELVEVTDALRGCTSRLDELHRSTSWRWTKPLRWASTVIRGKKQA